MEDQVKYLTEKGISAAFAGKHETTDADIAAGRFSIVFGSPELLVGVKKWRDMLQTDVYRERLIGMAVDEVHTIVLWGERHSSDAPFRKWCGLCKESCDGNASDLELHAAKPIAHKVRTVSNHQRESLRQMLMDRLEGDVDHGLCGKISVYHTLQEHYSTKDPMINETLQSCETLFCINDIICQVHVYDFNHAKIILETVMEVFGDCESDMDSNSFDDSVNIFEFDAMSLHD
ncbi:mediator of RNA polymerase II transcription subunit 34-like protein [Labeo rohita]|uniref:Mediator of RNA polymerase II transcription subunit 34-like protein n=1 Tax=Labeo rohita TaxID=84645 RepID=A0A498MEC5_LABRO|nr:mediator of RNA polymerase II transcription subunit 34-like protein [Labeo rohita]